MIEKRQSTFVITNGLVPVDGICDKIAGGATFGKLYNLYPTLDRQDIVDAISFYAENTVMPNTSDEQLLDLINVGKDEFDVVIEITRLHQIPYMKLLATSLKYYPHHESFTSLVNLALRICCLRIIDKKESGITEMTDAETLVNSALLRNIPNVLVDIERTRQDLDYEEYVETKARMGL